MNRQTGLQVKEAVPLRKNRASWLHHAAVRPVAEHETMPGSAAGDLAVDLTSVRPQAQAVGQSATRSCPMSPQRCPFGGACHSCPPRVQAKLKIGQPGDKYEQEADRVAEQVMRMPEPSVQRKGCSSPGCKEEDEDKILQAKSVGSAGSAPAQVDHPLIQNVLSSPGQPLDAGTRSFMEPRFGQDFSGVRVHTDGQAAESAQAVNARAYTVGRDVVFGAGQYVPESYQGKRLMAHELTHVGQQQNLEKARPELMSEISKTVSLANNYFSLPCKIIQREISGVYRLSLRNDINREIRDQGNQYAIAIVSGIALTSMPGRYDDTVSAFLNDAQTELSKYALGQIVSNIPGAGIVPSVLNAMNSARKNVEAENITDAFNAFKKACQAVLLAGVERMTNPGEEINQRVQDLIMERANQDPRFNIQPSGTQDADIISRLWQPYVRNEVSLQMFNNQNVSFSELINRTNDFIQRSFQYFILARAEVGAAYRRCMAQQATEGSPCDQGFWSFTRYPRECRHRHCRNWLNSSFTMPEDWTGPRPRQEQWGQCGGQLCSWYTVSTGVRHDAGRAYVSEREYNRERSRYRRR